MSREWLPYHEYQAQQRNQFVANTAAVGFTLLMLARKAPPMFWTWPRYLGFFALVILLPAGVLGMLMTLAVAPSDPTIMEHGVPVSMLVSFAGGVFLASLPTLITTTLVWLAAMPVRSQWGEYRRAGWKAKDCRAMYRYSRATGYDLVPPEYTPPAGRK